MFNFDQNKLLVDQKLGQGGFGCVYPYTSRRDPNGEQSVVKVQDVSFKGLKYAIQEIALGFDCQHRNILSINGFDLEKLQQPRNNLGQFIEYSVYIKMPRMVASLFDKITNHEVIPEIQILKYLKGITSGLCYLHKKQIAHRDIKPHNILLDQNGTIKIADIGIAKHLGNATTGNLGPAMGTLKYIAPEVVERGDEIKKDELCSADLWSLGLTMLELCLSKELDNKQWFLAMNKDRLSEKISSLERKYSQDLIDIIRSLLEKEPDKRIKIEELLKSLSASEEESYEGEFVEEEKSVEREESGEHRIINSESGGRRGPGQVTQEEIEDREGSILNVRDQIQGAYGKLFTVEANETEKALNLKCKNDGYNDLSIRLVESKYF